MSELDTFRELYANQQIFSEIANITGDEFRIQQELRKHYSAELVRKAISVYELRTKAKDKFSLSSQMWFDRVSYEQATPEIVAQHKALRFKCDEILDLCSGMGMDTIAHAKTRDVIAYDVDPLKHHFMQWNAEAYACNRIIKTEVEDVTKIDLMGKWIHIDPDRRSSGSPQNSRGRSVRLEDYEPGLEFLQQLTTTAKGGAIKVGPASNFGGKFQHVETELVSVKGECKEATIWFGELATKEQWRATLFPSNNIEEKITFAGHPLDHRAMQSPVCTYIYDPDPAVVRAGLVDLVADELSLNRLDDAEEYLTSDEVVMHPAMKTFRVVDVLAYDVKKLKRHMAENNIGILEIKCRHLSVNTDVLRKKLSLKGNQSAALILLKEQGQSKAVLCERITR